MIGNDDAADVGRIALRKIAWRLLPLVGLGYALAYMDRINISFAALQMNQDLGFSDKVYGLGAGLFGLSYCLFEVPSNLLLARFGARRWIGRIMVTWGAIAIGMLLVRTPLQFYAMRFALGAAEAGFFPGVILYLKQWFPATHSGRAISRFYVAVPLGAACMAALSGPLLGLRGVAQLAGWQWLFLVEGAPAVLLGALIFFLLPDAPATVRWLSDAERHWLTARLPAALPSAVRQGLANAFTHRLVWQLGVCNFLILGSNYAFSLSAPLLLRSATHWTAQQIGFVISGTALLGSASMLFNGWHSDRYGERHRHVAVPLVLMAACMVVIATTRTPALLLSAFVLYYLGTYAVQAAFWPLPSDALRGDSAAVGLAAIGSMGMFGGFVGPYVWGIAKDQTGGYGTGLLALGGLYAVAALAVLALRHPRRCAGETNP